jgi:hypothetical protein
MSGYQGMTTETDAAVVRRVLAGDGEAFGVLVARHHDRCLRLAVHLVATGPRRRTPCRRRCCARIAIWGAIASRIASPPG